MSSLRSFSSPEFVLFGHFILYAPFVGGHLKSNDIESNLTEIATVVVSINCSIICIKSYIIAGQICVIVAILFRRRYGVT
jgi:hypothetical protein